MSGSSNGARHTYFDPGSLAMPELSPATGSSVAHSTNGVKIEVSQGIKMEDIPILEPEVIETSVSPPAPTMATGATINTVDPKDPEGFLRRCSGYTRKMKARCSQVIGKNSQSANPTFLPTCKTHRNQQSFAGRCQFTHQDGAPCGRLFRWTPPYLELCSEHEGRSNLPCYFMNLPTELRQHIYSYLLPTEPIRATISEPEFGPYQLLPHHRAFHPQRRRQNINKGDTWPPVKRSDFPSSLVDLFLSNRQVYEEAKDKLHTTVPFVIDVKNEGTFMCGRRLLEPRRADGYINSGEVVEEARKRFIQNFDFTAVKNYNVNIVVENCRSLNPFTRALPISMQNDDAGWDEEVEMYDIRDYVGVVVSGILGQARNLCKLNVRLRFSKFTWSHAEQLSNTRCILAPFERLRNVRQPKLDGVFKDSAYLINPYHPDFRSYKKSWENLLKQSAPTSLTKKPPIRAMFTEFKEFYTILSTLMYEITEKTGRKTFLHRARVARENEDVEAFRLLQNELTQYWYNYLDRQEAAKDAVSKKLSRMLDMDTYPTSEVVPEKRKHLASSTSLDLDTPMGYNPAKMKALGIPVQGDQVNGEQMRQLHMQQQQHMRMQQQQRMRHQPHMHQLHVQQQQRQQRIRQRLMQDWTPYTNSPMLQAGHRSSAFPSQQPYRQWPVGPRQNSSTATANSGITPVSSSTTQVSTLASSSSTSASSSSKSTSSSSKSTSSSPTSATPFSPFITTSASPSSRLSVSDGGPGDGLNEYISKDWETFPQYNPSQAEQISLQPSPA